jgi:hypothetical protein
MVSKYPQLQMHTESYIAYADANLLCVYVVLQFSIYMSRKPKDTHDNGTVTLSTRFPRMRERVHEK